ncbi:MAG: LysR family transcriptional regulator [Pseudomonadota bacterium]
MDKLGAMRTFTLVVDHGGFAAAARELGLSRSVVNRAVMGLEQSLGVQLLTRSTRKVAPTETGLAFYDRCSQIISAVDDTLRSVRESVTSVSGRLRINAPMSFGTLRLAACVAAFMADYPDVHIELVLSDRAIDPIEEGFDITLRISEPLSSTSLVVRPLVPIPRLLCAAPAYLKRRGMPANAAALVDHDCLQYGYSGSQHYWRLHNGQGGTLRSFKIACRLWSNNGEVLKAAALAGQGIALLPKFLIDDVLSDGTLVPVLPDYLPTQLTLSALYPRHRHLSATTRVFVDALSDHLSMVAAKV